MKRLYWTEVKNWRGVWRRMDGWEKRADAERSAKFYRREYHAAARVCAYDAATDQKVEE